MLQDQSGIFWFGTTDGVYQFDGSSITYFLANKKIENKAGLRLKNVQCMFQDSHGIVWLGSGFAEQEGVCRFDGKAITSTKPNDDGWIRSVVEDKQGKIWLATRHHGIAVFDGKTFTDWSANMPAIHRQSVTTLVRDSKGNIWFSPELGEGNGETGNYEGLWRYDGKSITTFGRKDGLTNSSAWCIVEDRSGHIWVGTRNNGLFRYDAKGFRKFSE